MGGAFLPRRQLDVEAGHHILRSGSQHHLARLVRLVAALTPISRVQAVEMPIRRPTHANALDPKLVRGELTDADTVRLRNLSACDAVLYQEARRRAQRELIGGCDSAAVRRLC